MMSFPIAPTDYQYAVKINGKIYPPSEGFSVRGIVTGEYRAPKAGEWYVSGALPECYLAPNDLTSSYAPVRIIPVPKEE